MPCSRQRQSESVFAHLVHSTLIYLFTFLFFAHLLIYVLNRIH